MESLPNEIVIVRRRNTWDEDNAPHGVWKIAYADFMTALMAFFLVMWLINVTDESVRRGVAQYFNPVKLASTAPNRKGLNDPIVNGDTNENGTKLFTGKLGAADKPVDQDTRFGQGNEKGQEDIEVAKIPDQTGASPTDGQFTQTHTESILFTDPYAVLDTLAQKVQVAKSGEANPDGIGSGLQKKGARGGEAYRDPFDPQFWQFRPGRGVDGAATVTEGLPAETGTGAGAGPSDVRLDGDKTWAAPFDENGTSQSPEMDTGTGPSRFALTGQGNKDGTGTELQESPVVAHVTGKPEEGAALKIMASGNGTVDAAENTAAARVVAQLSEVLEAAEGTALEKTAAQITVTRQEDGALISLTDDQSFGMFAIGSAEPRPELVKLLERLGKVIAETPGQIIVTGHTDARPFKSKTYDNWRLSSARAHMALYMLNRGGVGKNRFIRIEGAADRRLKNTDDPFAASNRRVEIYLLEEGAE